MADVRRLPFPSHRGWVIGALRAGRRSYPVHGILELDVTDAVARLDADPGTGSFTAFVVAATARAAHAHPLVHAYRDWRGRLVVHDRVDVATIVEVHDEGRTFPLAHVLRDADRRTVAELTRELHEVRDSRDRSGSGRMLGGRSAGVLARVPGFTWLVYRAIARSPRLRARTGTVNVTAVGMFGTGGGIGIPHPTVMTLSVLVGGRSLRPRVVEGAIVPRLVLDLTVTVDHALVDGGPAARFAAALSELIEDPGWLDEG